MSNIIFSLNFDQNRKQLTSKKFSPPPHKKMNTKAKYTLFILFNYSWKSFALQKNFIIRFGLVTCRYKPILKVPVVIWPWASQQLELKI